MLEKKETYTIRELFDGLDISLAEMGRRSDLHPNSLARIREGGSTRRPTANKLLKFFSAYYGQQLSLKNVSGIEIFEMGNRQQRGEELQTDAKSNSAA